MKVDTHKSVGVYFHFTSASQPAALLVFNLALLLAVWSDRLRPAHRARSSQKATALAAATLRESTPWDMGMHTV